MPVTSIHFSSIGKTSPQPKSGDVKVSGKGVFIRRPSMYNGCYIRINGRQRYYWERVGDAPPEHKGRMKLWRADTDEAGMYLEMYDNGQQIWTGDS